MAIGANALTSGSSATVASSYATASVTPGANRLVLIAVTSLGPSSTTPNQPTATGNGLTWIAVNSIAMTTGITRYRTTVLRSMGASPTAGAITIDFAAQNQRGCEWSVIEFTGVDTSGTNGSGAVVQSGTNTAGSSTAESVMLAPFSGPDNRIYAVSFHGVNEGSTPAAEITEIHDVQLASPTMDQASGWGTHLYGGNTFSWTTATTFLAVALEMKASGGAPTESYPSFVLQLSTSAPASAPTWQDISTYLVDGNLKRGRQFELSRVETGTAEFTVTNLDRRFDPTYTSGPYYPNLVPLRRVRLRGTWNGSTYGLFDGYLESIDQIWPAKGAQVAFAKLKCVDAFEVLARRILTSTYATGSFDQMTFTTKVIGSSLGPSGDGRSYGYGWARSGSPSGSAVAGPLTIRGVMDTTADAATTYVTFNPATSTITITYDQGSGTPGRRQYKIVGDINGSVAGQIVQASVIGGGQNYATNWTVVMAYQYVQERSDLRIKRVLDAISWPSTDRVLRTGVATVQPFEFHPDDNVTPLQHMQDISATELGILYMDGLNRVVYLDRNHRTVAPYSVVQAILTDDPADLTNHHYIDLQPQYDSRYLYNKITVTRNGGNPQTASDATSITNFLTRELNLSTVSSADSDSTAIASALLAKFKDIKMRYGTLSLVPEGPSSLQWGPILGFDISTRITVKRTPPGASQQWSQDCYIESISHTFARHPQYWRTDWELSPA